MDANIHNLGEQLSDIVLLFDGYMPENTKICFEELQINGLHKYIIRATYTSKSSGRQMCIVAKGDELPHGHDQVFFFYLRQLVLTPQEIRTKFSRLYFLERRARQEQFLFGGKNTRVATENMVKDTLSFDEYTQNAEYQLDSMKRETNSNIARAQGV